MSSVPRPGWQDLPPPVRARITDRLGARVLGWNTLPGSDLAATAMQLQTSSGSLVCTARHAADPGEREDARRAIEVVAGLPAAAPAPALLWWFDEDFGSFGHWTIAGWSFREMRPVGAEWTDGEVAAALRIVRRIAAVEPDAGGPYLDAADAYGPDTWYRLAQDRPDGLRNFSPWLEPRLEALADIAKHTAEAVAGTSLVHGAISRHALLLPAGPDDDTGVAIGWSRASRGAPFVDTVHMLAHIRAEGGPAPEVVLARHPLPRDIDPDAVTCLVTALTGQYIEAALRPSGGGTRTQEGLARVCLEWLRRRLGF